MSVSATIVEGGARPDRRDLATLAGDPGLAIEDDEELVAGLTLRDQGLPGWHPDVLRPLRDQLEVLAGAGREERHLLQVLDECVSSRHMGGK